MNAVVDREQLKQRELTARVTTLELLVADLIHIVRQIDPALVEAVAAEAAKDVMNQTHHLLPEALEHQRFRLQQVLDSRARNLARKRFSSRLATQHHAATD